MIQDQAPAQKPERRTHWPSILVILNASLGLLIFLGIAGATFLSGFINLFNPEVSSDEVAVLFSYSVAGLLLFVLLLPSIVMGIQRVSGRPVSHSQTLDRILAWLHPKKLIWLYPIILLAGFWIMNNSFFTWFLMPLLNVLALTLPIAWLVWAGSRRLARGSLQRSWSVFGLGITVSPVLILLLEILFMIVGFFIIAFLLSVISPGTNFNLDLILPAFSDPTELQQIPEELILDFIKQPIILSLILVFISGLVPLIEELIKPIAIWVLWRTPLTEQDGWRLGLLGGAGFALIENLGNLAIGEGWEFLVLARVGASALHIFNTAIISYTAVLARLKRRYLPVVLAILGTILIHGLWNGITIFATISSLEGSANNTGTWPIGFIILLVILSISLIGGILVMNRKLSGQDMPTPVEDTGSEQITPELNSPEPTESE